MLVFKLFAESTKEHQVDSIICTACDPRPTLHQGCPLSGLMHYETFPEKPEDLSAFSVTLISGGKEPVRVPTPEPVTAGHKSVCDKCG